MQKQCDYIKKKTEGNKILKRVRELMMVGNHS